MINNVFAVATAIILASCQGMSDRLIMDGVAPAMMVTTLNEIIIENDDVHLAATVLSPKEPNGFGVVMLPGSGPATRDMLRAPGEELTKFGYTVLIFDKRGSGESGGSWVRSSLDDLASDAIAAMNFLNAHDGIDGVGFWAHSQGNWVTTRAAEMGAQPAFFIAVAGGGAASRETETHYYRQRLLNMPDAAQREAMTFVDAYFNYLSGDIARTAFDDLVRSAKTKDWFEQLGIERVLVSEDNRSNWQWVADYDPAISAAARSFPTLVVLGGADDTIALDLTITDWNAQLAMGQNSDSRIEIFVGRNHHLRLASDDHGHGVTTDTEVWATIGHWLTGLPLTEDPA